MNRRRAMNHRTMQRLREIAMGLLIAAVGFASIWLGLRYLA